MIPKPELHNGPFPEALATGEPREPFVIKEIPATPEAQSARGWELRVNGELVDNVTSLQLDNPRMGVDLHYGHRPEGYDGFVIHEQGGGGPITLPYVILPDGIHVGLARERRDTLGGVVENAPRGFLDPGENHEEAAERELAEETGVRGLARRLQMLGVGINPNSAFFDTSRDASDGLPEGARTYGLPVSPEDLEAFEENGVVQYRFKQAIRDEAEGDKAGERIFGTVFVPIDKVRHSPDMYTRAAVGDLMLNLMAANVIRLVGVDRSYLDNPYI